MCLQIRIAVSCKLLSAALDRSSYCNKYKVMVLKLIAKIYVLDIYVREICAFAAVGGFGDGNP
jgi:hypothetical protein